MSPAEFSSRPQPEDELIHYLKVRITEQLSDGGAVSEYDLMKALRDDGRLAALFETGGGDSLTLFRAHFVLFHALYRLADELAESRAALLEISPLAIRWKLYQTGESDLTQTDAVRAYYLDWQNYEQQTAQAVDELITSFWLGLAKQDGREQALRELGLVDPVDDETIRRTYQRLVMEHHPDRGGENEKILAINAAVRILLK